VTSAQIEQLYQIEPQLHCFRLAKLCIARNLYDLFSAFTSTHARSHSYTSRSSEAIEPTLPKSPRNKIRLGLRPTIGNGMWCCERSLQNDPDPLFRALALARVPADLEDMLLGRYPAARFSVSSSLLDGYDDPEILPCRSASCCFWVADGEQPEDWPASRRTLFMALLDRRPFADVRSSQKADELTK